MQIVNLTPHTFVVERPVLEVCPNTGEYTQVAKEVQNTFPSNGVARVETLRHVDAPILCEGELVRFVKQSFGAVVGLPEPQEGTIFVVSAVVLSALKGSRPDVYGPDTGPDAIRENGQVIAVRGLVQ